MTRASLVPRGMRSPVPSRPGRTRGSRAGTVLTLPYGAVAGTNQPAHAGPLPVLTQPSFDVLAATGSPVTLTGAYQLTLRPPPLPADPNAPVFAGRTYLRTQEDNPPGTLPYGEQVLGLDVAFIFTTKFNNPPGGVPVKRYDLTGYGAN